MNPLISHESPLCLLDKSLEYIKPSNEGLEK
jgi:hypothetical protein